MEIILNNTLETIPGDEMTIGELLRFKNFTFRLIITRVNGRLVRKEDREGYIIRAGDEVMVLHLISGG